MVVRVCLATSGCTIILLQYASHSCRRLHVGMLVAGEVQGFVVTNRKLCAHETAFSSFLFPNRSTRMSFAAQGYKAHMVFAALESPYSDKVVA